MKTTKILSPNSTYRIPPKPGAQAVLWLIDGLWVHKGWLMPQVNIPECTLDEENPTDEQLLFIGGIHNGKVQSVPRNILTFSIPHPTMTPLILDYSGNIDYSKSIIKITEYKRYTVQRFNTKWDVMAVSLNEFNSYIDKLNDK